jgi:hypothetical protein
MTIGANGKHCAPLVEIEDFDIGHTVGQDIGNVCKRRFHPRDGGCLAGIVADIRLNFA